MSQANKGAVDGLQSSSTPPEHFATVTAWILGSAQFASLLLRPRMTKPSGFAANRLCRRLSKAASQFVILGRSASGAKRADPRIHAVPLAKRSGGAEKRNGSVLRGSFSAFVLVLGGASPAFAANATIEKAIDGFVRPAYAALDAAAAKQAGDMQALCADPAPGRLATARNGFKTLVGAWGEVETIRFGPVTEENRLDKILFWPDRKSIGLKQVQAALADKDPTAADPATLKGKSVAMQGLGALEFVLFGSGSEALEQPGDPYRCAYGLAVARNIEGMAASIDDAWRAPDGIARLWANPGAGNTLYRTDDEAMTELFDVFVHGLEMTRDVRLNGFLGQTAEDDKPRQAIFWRSGATALSLQANMRGLQKLFDASELAELLPPDSAWIAQSIGFEFRTAARMLEAAKGPVADVLAAPERGSLPAFRLITSHLSELFGVNMAGALGLSAGFSSLDGD